MLNTNEVAKIYDTILIILGMTETVELSVQKSRKNVWLLNRTIERSLHLNEGGKANRLVELFLKESLQDLAALSDDCLTKAG